MNLDKMWDAGMSEAGAIPLCRSLWWGEVSCRVLALLCSMSGCSSTLQALLVHSGPRPPIRCLLWAHRGYSYTKARAYYRPLLEFPSIAHLSAGHLGSQIPLPSSTRPLMPEPQEDYLDNVGVSQSDYTIYFAMSGSFSCPKTSQHLSLAGS